MQKSVNDILEQEYLRFIEFGQLLDRQTRKYLVRYLQNKLEPGKFELLELNDQYYTYFCQALDRLFALEYLLPICQQNKKITQQIILDTLRWLRKAYQKASIKNPYEQEIKRLENWAITPLHIFISRWDILIQFAQANYPKEQLDTAFYKDQFKILITSQHLEEIPKQNREKLELIYTDLLAQWDALLQSKILEFQLKKLEEEQTQFLGLIEAKVKEYHQLQQLISPYSEYLGWDLSRTLWQETSFDIIKHYQELLENEQSLKELADLLGKMREAEIEIEEETFEKTIIRQEWIKDEWSKAEIVGIHGSDDLSNLLSSEASLLGDENTELLFLKKYADKNLLTFKYEDRQLVKSEEHFMETQHRVKEKEKGPFIVCVDTSESMTGRPEQIAKVLCLGILKMAIRENRPAYLINFSIGIKTLDLYNVAGSIDELAKFLQMSFYGGTDISLPLYEAIRQLKTERYRDADVLVISDFIMYRIDKEVLKDVKYFQQNQGTQFHSLTLSNQPNTFILDAFDTNWVYNPKERGIIKALTREMKSIGERRI